MENDFSIVYRYVHQFYASTPGTHTNIGSEITQCVCVFYSQSQVIVILNNQIINKTNVFEVKHLVKKV